MHEKSSTHYTYATDTEFLPEQWIWLPEAQYPTAQTTAYSRFFDPKKDSYTVAEFQKTYTFTSVPTKVRLRTSGDTAFQLYCNGQSLATGPAPAGSDYKLGRDIPRPEAFAFLLDYTPKENTLCFFARVRMMPEQMYESSKGHGGFMLSGIAEFADGTCLPFGTDETWQARRNGAYVKSCHFDGRIAPDPFLPAQVTENLWHTFTAPIPPRVEQAIYPQEGHKLHLEPGQSLQTQLTLDKIYTGFVYAKAKGNLEVDVNCREDTEKGTHEYLTFAESGVFRGFYTHSAGNLFLQAQNTGDTPAELEIHFVSTHYPVALEAETLTSDADLNLVLNTCRHTLKICRQSLHLDSPRHCEPLACTGDYYIESLMTLFAFGDMRLAEFDLMRTADMLTQNDGRMFHTTYSLIWVRMLRQVYQFTGNLQLLHHCQTALGKLLTRFRGYLGDNGLLETPPDYMFVDWIYTDGLSLHHPPKALGQTCLNLFYFDALGQAEELYRLLGEKEAADACAAQKEALRTTINALLYDSEKQMYVAGLNTQTPEELVHTYMPQNVEKTYYIKQPNILAAFTGVCDGQRAKMLLHKVMQDEIEGEYQPYFAHFLLDAVYKNGLREQYTLKLLEQWKQPVKDCPKGLAEGFVKPEPTYSFDHSHAWGGTPLYSLPQALLGLQINQAGLRDITLSPNLLGLESAKVELPTPLGLVTVQLAAGQAPKITAPTGIRVRVNE